MKKLIKWCKNNSVCILNADFKGDEEGSYTFIGHGKTVINYAIMSAKASRELEILNIKGVIAPDRLPMDIQCGKRLNKKGKI